MRYCGAGGQPDRQGRKDAHSIAAPPLCLGHSDCLYRHYVRSHRHRLLLTPHSATTHSPTYCAVRQRYRYISTPFAGLRSTGRTRRSDTRPPCVIVTLFATFIAALRFIASVGAASGGSGSLPSPPSFSTISRHCAAAAARYKRLPLRAVTSSAALNTPLPLVPCHLWTCLPAYLPARRHAPPAAAV